MEKASELPNWSRTFPHCIVGMKICLPLMNPGELASSKYSYNFPATDCVGDTNFPIVLTITVNNEIDLHLIVLYLVRAVATIADSGFPQRLSVYSEKSSRARCFGISESRLVCILCFVYRFLGRYVLKIVLCWFVWNSTKEIDSWIHESQFLDWRVVEYIWI